MNDNGMSSAISNDGRRSVSESFKMQEFDLGPDLDLRNGTIVDVTQLMQSLPIDRVFHVKVKKGQRTRKDVANGLYQIAMAQVAKQHTHYDHPLVIAGISKYELLLPYKQAWGYELGDEELIEEAELERALCDGILANDNLAGDMLYRGFDRAIRSKTLKVTPFCRYLDLFLDHWARAGVAFNLNPNERARARSKT